MRSHLSMNTSPDPLRNVAAIALCAALAGCASGRLDRHEANDATSSASCLVPVVMANSPRQASSERAVATPRAGTGPLPVGGRDTYDVMPPMGAPTDLVVEPEMGMGHGEEVPHPFLTHMGVPDPVGSYNFRVGATATRADDGGTVGDASFHFETGLTSTVGFHLRNDGVLNQQHTEAMFQFAAVRSRDGMSGFSPIIEFEFPTHSGGDQHVNTLVGFSTALANSRVAFNQVIHYDPRNDMLEGSASLVWRWLPRLFPVVEIGGEWGRDELPVVNVLGGLKYRVCESRYVGVAVEAPVTVREDYSARVLFTFDFEF